MSKKKLEILLVDDDEIFIVIARRTFEACQVNCDIQSFWNGRVALDYLNEHFDQDVQYLVFLDINMPILNGWQFLDELEFKPFKEDLIIFMATSSIDFHDALKAKNHPLVKDYLTKPILFETVDAVMSIPEVKYLI